MNGGEWTKYVPSRLECYHEEGTNGNLKKARGEYLTECTTDNGRHSSVNAYQADASEHMYLQHRTSRIQGPPRFLRASLVGVETKDRVFHLMPSGTRLRDPSRTTGSSYQRKAFRHPTWPKGRKKHQRHRSPVSYKHHFPIPPCNRSQGRSYRLCRL